jgi:RNA polymerase sigma-70 factor (ECF subfamily)
LRKYSRPLAALGRGSEPPSNYLRDSHAGVSRANGFFVLTLDGEEAISAITRFGDNGVLPYFGLPRTLPG